MRHLKDRLILYVLSLVVGVFLHQSAYALVADSSSFNLNFRFNNPGARSNGMGGAFIGVADDATAAYTNPAGLTILTEPEVSVEYKVGEYDNTFTLFGPPNSQDFTETSSGFSFLSLVYPIDKVTLSVYRHEVLNIKSEDNFDDFSNFITMERDINAVTYAAGIGLKITDRFSLGASVGFAQLKYYYTNEIFNDASFTPPPDTRILIDGTDFSEQFSLSLLWNPIGGFNFGLVYRYGPEFKVTYEMMEDTNGDDTFDEFRSTKNTLKIPDVFGAGVSYRFNFGLTLAADVNYIEYSDLLKDFRFPDGSTEFGGISADDFKVDDTYEIHAGIEYVFSIGNVPVAVRGGYTHKPAHRIYYEGSTEGFLEGWKNWAPKGEDDNIFAVGLGGVFWERLQLDGAASFGDFEKEFTVSLVYRF